jgi:NADPH:quinone reductase-like Zn-dependent oxidoreductase
VDAASVNGIDAMVAAGYVWDVMPHEFPVVLGRDFAGTVDAVGDGGSGIRVGDRVAGVITAMSLGAGAMAEAVTVDAASLVVVPASVSPVQAAAIGLAGVAATDLVAALEITAADVVLVAGATGGVGAFAVQLAAATGATVLATARPGEPSDFVRALGASVAVDHTADLAAAVSAAAPDGITAVVHAAGDPAALAALLRPKGRLASALGATYEQVGRQDVSVTAVLATATPEKVRSLLDAVEAGSLRVPVAHLYPFDQAARALADFSGHKLGKLVVAVR